MAKGIPIRLVQENGNLIELDATSMVLSTTRKVGGAALPWTGSRRIGMDWNINKAMINIQGVITDDREGTASVAHSATIDFGHYVTANSIYEQWNKSANLERLLDYRLKIQSSTAASDSETDKISFTSTTNAGGTAYSATGGAGSTPTVLVNTSDATPEQVATAVAAYINAQLSSKFTATVPTNGGQKASSDGALSDASTLVNIAMTSVGAEVAMRIRTPTFVPHSTLGAYFIRPTISKFSGGSDGLQKSAGDKVQDLYGVINNSSRRGFVGKITGAIGSGGRVKGSDTQDYIVGIQIPYNSTIKATGGEEYVARNFFMPTGFYYGKEKTSEGNNHPASVAMDLQDERMGIQGAVQKIDITYDAGESVYSFNMIFAPIDNMILS
tara:strand:- start:1349 stop:2500 length:1152 start_codon:yes stop_codon:yes gene_type:complete